MVVFKLLDSAIHSTSASQLQLILLFLFSIIVGNLLRNRYSHQLHQFPGPFWGSVTNLYQTYLFSTGTFHERVQSLHEEYGEWMILHAQGLLLGLKQ